MSKLIGRILATEKTPTTMDEFNFWTDASCRLGAFDIVKVKRGDNSVTFGVIESISHITDAQSFLTNYISSDFGDVDLDEPTLRVGMNYVKAKVAYNDKNIYTPVHNNDKVYLASADEITRAFGLDNPKNTLVCGYLKMYEDAPEEEVLPVKLNPKFILGPEGAHLNISGISGLAAKTSYAMFLMKSIQEQYQANSDIDDSVAFVIFNVKGCDLMAIDSSCDFAGDPEKKAAALGEYANMELSGKPFENVKYYIPRYDDRSAKTSTYLPKSDIKTYLEDGQLKKFAYSYQHDRESIEMMFSNIDDTTQTMEAIISKVIDDNDSDFGGLDCWDSFREKVREKTEKGSSDKGSKEISVLSWRKFKRIINKAISGDMFVSRVVDKNNECRLADEIKKIKANEVCVIDIAKLPEDKQAFVFGDALRTIYNLKLGEYDGEDGDIAPPSRIVVFIDELNKYASKDVPKSSPILRELLDVTERGRSLGVVLFGAEQFRSAIHPRITGNCATHAYGRTNTIETSAKDYGSLPTTYKNMLVRLEQGEYLIQNPVFRSLLKIRFPYPIYKQFK